MVSAKRSGASRESASAPASGVEKLLSRAAGGPSPLQTQRLATGAMESKYDMRHGLIVVYGWVGDRCDCES